MKRILFVSQSFYPNVGGVSSLLLNITRQLKLYGYKVFSLHFCLSENNKKRKVGNEFESTEIIVDINLFSKETIKLFSVFKEKLYRLFHTFDTTDELIELQEGYDAFQNVNQYFGDIISNLIEKHKIDLIHFQDYQIILAPEKKIGLFL